MSWYFRVGYFGFGFLVTLGAIAFVTGIVGLVLYVR